MRRMIILLLGASLALGACAAGKAPGWTYPPAASGSAAPAASPSTAPSGPAASAPAASAPAAAGGTLEIEAFDLGFKPKSLEVPAAGRYQVKLVNTGAIPHDISFPTGELTLHGRVLPASNATFVGEIGGVRVVYKPIAGERPLWDFPDGTLARREVATYLVSEATGWSMVPPTVLRAGPFGPGMCQLWIDTDEDTCLVDIVPDGAVPTGWLPVLQALGPGGRPVVLAHADDLRLRRLALFDAVVNNADRKAGHLLPAAGAVLDQPSAQRSVQRDHDRAGDPTDAPLVVPRVLLTQEGDAHSPDPTMAFAISRLTDSGYLNTSPIGIFRQVERPTYDDQAREQVTAAVAEAGNGDTADRSARLASLIGGGDTWTIL